MPVSSPHATSWTPSARSSTIFRRGYTLWSSARGVRREGWHEIAVTVPAHPDYTIFGHAQATRMRRAGTTAARGSTQERRRVL